MGYPECVGTEYSQGASPHDMLGAYYTFNWTERRVRDMAPQTGGRDRRLWAEQLLAPKTAYPIGLAPGGY